MITICFLKIFQRGQVRRPDRIRPVYGVFLTLILSVINITFAITGNGYCSDVIPEEIGKVVYEHRSESPYRIYIIGMGHRDTLTGTNGAETVQSQIEAYRIGEWLVHNEGLELLLPEGYFIQKGEQPRIPAVAEPGKAAYADTALLKERLGDDNAYVNSEMLLMRHFNLRAEQVEDPELYRAVIEKLHLLQRNRDNVFTYAFEKSQLDFLQEIRTASMLQKIPDIIKNTYDSGAIRKQQALFTIGLAHINDIVRYLKKQEIVIQSPPFTPFEDYASGVKLLQNDFGITVIIPPSLKDRMPRLAASYVKKNITR